MSRRLVSITLDNLADLPTQCRNCVYWELDPVAGERARDSGDTALEKEAWVSDTLLEWGSCGQLDLRRRGRRPATSCTRRRPTCRARSPSRPRRSAPDAVLLMTARLVPEFAGGGLGRMLVQGVARDIVRRGMRAIEAFGRIGAAPSAGWRGADYGCLLPADYLLAVGFKTVRPHPRTPRLRLDVKTTRDLEGRRRVRARAAAVARCRRRCCPADG